MFNKLYTIRKDCLQYYPCIYIYIYVCMCICIYIYIYVYIIKSVIVSMSETHICPRFRCTLKRAMNTGRLRKSSAHNDSFACHIVGDFTLWNRCTGGGAAHLCVHAADVAYFAGAEGGELRSWVLLFNEAKL